MKNFKLIADRVEIASLDASVMKDIDTFNIYDCANDFMVEHGYTDKLKYAYDVDWRKYLVHVYAITMREVEL